MPKGCCRARELASLAPIQFPAICGPGIPEATPGAAVLATGEAAMFPPEPQRQRGSLTPFSDRGWPDPPRAPTVPSTWTSSSPCCTVPSARTAPSRDCSNWRTSPYVGAGVLGSAAGMDKDVMKSLFRAAGLPIVKHVTVLRSDWEAEPKKVQKLVESKLKYPVFVKPANLGSSVGISKAHDRKELASGDDRGREVRSQDRDRTRRGRQQAKGPRDRMFGAGQRQARSFSAGRDRPRQGILRLHRQIC